MKTVRFGGNVSEVIKENEHGVDNNYQIIIQQLRDSHIKSNDLIQLLQQFMGVIPVLDITKKDLVGELLSIKWVAREKDVIELYLNFLVELISGNSVHQAQILHCLIRHLLPASSIVKNATPLVPEEEVFNLLHITLQRIFTLIPMTKTLILPMLSVHYPFKKKNSHVMKAYANNLLAMTKYLPSLRHQIFELIVCKTLSLDLICPRDVIRECLEDDDTLFKMDIEGLKTEPFPEKFDVMMEVLLKYVRDICFIDGTLSNIADTFFEEILSIFEKVILPIHECSHIQFIVFYMCSFKIEFREKFCFKMWKIFQNPNTPVIIRQTVPCYLASLCARAKFIDVQATLKLISLFSQWIHSYLKERETSSSYYGLRDAYRHSVFFSTCQAMFYIIIFRVKEILDLPDGFVLMRNIKLEHIVTSRLNPLKFCIKTVVDLFASIMRQHQIVYCDTIIEKNNRYSLPISGQSLKSGLVNPLDSFFPFDPYCLPRSAHLFDDIYQEYEGCMPNIDEKMANDENDSDLMEVAPMNIPNIFNDEKPVIGSISKKVFGISPGFSLVTPSPF